MARDLHTATGAAMTPREPGSAEAEMILSAKPSALWLVVAALAGCGAPGGEVDEGTTSNEDVAEAEQPITLAPPTAEVPWSVWITGLPGNGACSASVLTRRWLLTAGHCVDDANSVSQLTVSYAPSAGTSTPIYTGGAVLRAHPGTDIGLVFLQGGGIGNSINATGRAEIYVDEDEPWCDPFLKRNFAIAGWGLTNSGLGSSSCAANTSGTKRWGTGFTVDGGQCGDNVLSGENPGVTHICPGDSGSPWLLSSGTRRLAFAVTTTIAWKPFDHYITGTAIRPFLSWIESASAAVNPNFTLSRASGSINGTDYVTFSEIDTSPPPPDPPPVGTSCPSGQHCCEPGESSCDLCLPNNVWCP